MLDRMRIAGILALGLALLPAGCSKENEEPEHRQIEGTVEGIDLDAGQVSLRYLHKRSSTERVLSGKVTDLTEGLINGSVAELKDIRLKERIKVTGYKKGSGANVEIVAVRVEIDRPEWIETDQQSNSEQKPD